MNIHLDFETRSTVDIRKCGAWVYSLHPSTEVLCLAYALDDGEVKLITKDEIEKGIVYSFSFSPEDIFTAHNAAFEHHIWQNILVKRFGFPAIPARQWRCTAAKAAVLALPRALGNCAAALDLPYQKDMEGYKIMMKMCKPKKPTKKEKSFDELSGEFPLRWHESEEDFEILHKYCIGDVEVERSIDYEIRDLSKNEQEVWFLDQVINQRGIRIDMEAVSAALELVAQYAVECEAEVDELTDGYVDRVSRRQKVLTWIQTQGISLQDYTKETVNEALSGTLPPKVRRVLEIRRQLGKTSTAKYEAFTKATDDRGILCDTLLYHGASPGRWTGKLVQLHNPPRGTLKDTGACIDLMKRRDLEMFQMFYPEVMEAISSCIRGMLIAREGKEFFVSDFNAVEVRVLFWLANEVSGLTRYEKGQDLYVDMAMRIFETTDIDELKRFVGKQTVLGCGYGMGLNGERFQATCRQHGVTVSTKVAQTCPRMYRETYRAVPKFWKATEKAAIQAVLTGKTIRCGKIIWVVNKDFLYAKLPSGRCLAYHKPEIHEMALTHMGNLDHEYVRQTTWGGILVQNLCEGVARDIMVNGMFNVESAGYKVLLTVHDEVMSEREKRGRQKNLVVKGGNLEEYNKLLTSLPEWASGCPVKADGWKGNRYKKA